MAAKKYPGISRIDSGNTHGWFVRVYRKGKTHSKFYSDLKYGGKGKALKLALDERTRLNKRLGPPATKGLRVMTRNANNTSGVIGVSKTSKKSPTGVIRSYYTVSWRPEPNLARNKAFSIDSIGEKKAFELAVAFRKKMEREIKGKAKALLAKTGKK
jgi:hypothetical protein